MTPSQNRSRGRFAKWASAVDSVMGPRYVVASLAFGGALFFRYLLREPLGLKVPYLQFYPAVILAAWYGGLGPGLLITTLSSVAAMYFLLPPAGIAVGDAADQLSLGVFAVTGVVISWLNHRLHEAQAAHRTAAETAMARAEPLTPSST